MNLRSTIETYFESARIAIENALANPTILNYLAEWGYTSERLETGRTLYQAAVSAQQQQKEEYSEQVGATETLDRSREAARKTYNRLVKVSRAVLNHFISSNNGCLIIYSYFKSNHQELPT